MSFFSFLHQFFFSFLSFLFQIFVRSVYSSPVSIPLPTGRPVEVTIDLKKPLAEVSEKFLSFSIDSAEFLGGYRWNSTVTIEIGKGRKKTSPVDLTQKKLINLTLALSPAYLRVGGTEADSIIFDDSYKDKNALSLTQQAWDKLNFFVKQTGTTLFFTVNAGPLVRDSHHQWQSTNLESLLRYSKEKGYLLKAFELGNELNAFWFFHGFHNKIYPKQYSKDFKKFKTVVKKYYPQAKVGGAATLYWPRIGEAFSFVGAITSTFIKESGTEADMFTWHYYPQQSERCPITFPKAKHGLLCNSQNLNDIGIWATELTGLKNSFSPQAEMWIGEIGNALCGGQPGISDTFESSLWWTDVLGFMASKGQRVIVRQDLIGSSYSLLDKRTLTPLPDFWASVLWKKLMGKKVYNVHSSNDNPYIRIYAHNTNTKSGYQSDGISMVFINLQNKENSIFFNNLNADNAVVYKLSAKNLNEKSILLNDKPLALVNDKMPVLKGNAVEIKNNTLDLAPLSITYLVLPHA